MKKSRFTESQIIAIPSEAEAGMKVKDVCRKHGISDATYYNWKAKYGGSILRIAKTGFAQTYKLTTDLPPSLLPRRS